MLSQLQCRGHVQFPETADEEEWVRCLCGAACCTGFMNRGEDEHRCTLFGKEEGHCGGGGDGGELAAGQS